MATATMETTATTETATETTVRVKARRAGGADVGPVTLALDATVGELRRAIYDAEWLERERGDGSASEPMCSEKPPSYEYVMILCDGKMLGPDEKSLEACGVRVMADGQPRVLHAIITERAAVANESGLTVVDPEKLAAAQAQPTCCSVM